MTDYLRPVGPAWRRLALIVCVPASLVCGTLTLLLVLDMIHRGSPEIQGKPLWVAACVLGVLALSSRWIVVRLWRGTIANGVTLMPVWFIEVFGALLLMACIWLLISGRWAFGLSAALGVAVSMLLIRRQVRRRRHEMEAPAEDPPTDPGEQRPS
jgi:hypothetical protein